MSYPSNLSPYGQSLWSWAMRMPIPGGFVTGDGETVAGPTVAHGGGDVLRDGKPTPTTLYVHSHVVEAVLAAVPQLSGFIKRIPAAEIFSDGLGRYADTPGLRPLREGFCYAEWRRVSGGPVGTREIVADVLDARGNVVAYVAESLAPPELQPYTEAGACALPASIKKATT